MQQLYNKHFDRLTEIVGDVYGVEPRLLVSKLLIREVSTPRRILAAIWARGGDSWQSVARLVGWSSRATPRFASFRFEELMKHPAHSYKIGLILDRCKEELPWLVVE